MIDMPEASAGAESITKPRTQRDIVLYALLASLTRFIPFPFVDDFAHTRIHRLMVSKLSRAHALDLTETQARVLAAGAKRVRARNLAMLSAKALIKRLLRKTVMLFSAKEATDTFSLTYHIGYLLDYAMQKSWVTRRSAQEIRTAVETVCDEVDTSPLNYAVYKIMQHSVSITGILKDYLVELATGRKADAKAADEVLEEAPDEARDLADKIQSALDVMPSHYFIELQQRLAQHLRMEGSEGGGQTTEVLKSEVGSQRSE
jgi:uncharacterized protein (DUF697 family)